MLCWLLHSKNSRRTGTQDLSVHTDLGKPCPHVWPLDHMALMPPAKLPGPYGFNDSSQWNPGQVLSKFLGYPLHNSVHVKWCAPPQLWLDRILSSVRLGQAWYGLRLHRGHWLSSDSIALRSPFPSLHPTPPRLSPPL